MLKIKILILLFITFLISSCSDNLDNNRTLQSRIDSLEKKLAGVYKPGLGEFMSGIQVHHAKLWFAGKNQNWELADFELHEILEAMENIKKYEQDRKETKMINIIDFALDSVDNSIKQKDPVRFNSSFTLLTKTCNSCHQAAEFGFNVVKIPDAPPFSNQDFELKK
jgi:hypothetical protein